MERSSPSWVSNSTGSITSNAATLTVSAAAVPPSITTQPASQTVTAGLTATFTVGATGTTPLTYQWKKNGTAMAGATSSSYTTLATTSSDNGAQFTVVVSNSTGSITSNAATLTVSAAAVPPSITTQPASQTVTAGLTATFTVGATGTTPLTYQWKKNGTAMAGATSSSYTTLATTSSDNGAQFTVAVSDSAGSVTSNAATLTVNPSSQPLQITTSSLPGGQMQTSYTTSLQATGGTAPYTWSVISGQLPNGVSLSPANGTMTGTPTLAGTFTFSIQVKDNSGVAASAAFSIDITAAPLAISTTSLPAGTDGQGYSAQLNATGGTAPYTWSVASGGLPVGLTLSSSGAISGVPSAAGTSTFTVKTDGRQPADGAAKLDHFHQCKHRVRGNWERRLLLCFAHGFGFQRGHQRFTLPDYPACGECGEPWRHGDRPRWNIQQPSYFRSREQADHHDPRRDGREPCGVHCGTQMGSEDRWVEQHLGNRVGILRQLH